MEEQLAVQGGVTSDSASAPAAPSPEIEKVREEFESRFKGLQRVIAEKDEVLSKAQAELKELKTAGLSEDERAQLHQKDLSEQLDKLSRENELLKLSREYPDEMPVFEKLLQADSTKTQLETIREIRAAIAKAQTPAKQEETEVPDVNPINPPRRDFGGVVMPDGTTLTEDIADRILKTFGKR
jgi:hypothetical protein